MRKFSAIFILLILTLYTSAQVSIKLEIPHTDFKYAYLFSVYGEKLNAISKTQFKNGVATFTFSNNLKKGMYKILLEDKSQINVIIDKDKEITLSSKQTNINKNIKVLKGEDNKKLYNFTNFRTNEIRKLNNLISKISSSKNSKQLSERVGFLKGVSTYKIQKFADSLVSIDSSIFVSKLIKAMIIPDLNLYMLNHTSATKYNYDVEFLMLHFFDNIDFNDTLMLKTDILYKTIKTYIEKIVLPRNVVGFNYANNFIIEKANNNSKVKNNIISTLLKIYEKTQLEEVYLKLYNEYVFKNSNILSPQELKNVNKKIKIINSGKSGNKAIDFTFFDINGKETSISEITTNFNLLVFYKSDTKNIKSTIKQLNDIYTNYKKNGLKIIAISTDTNAIIWKSFLSKNKPLYNNYIIKKDDLKIVENNYNTWALPSIYILKKDLIIAAKPINVDYVKKECERAFK